DEGGRFAGRIEYNTDLFDEARIKRIGESYNQLLAAAVREPDRRVFDLPLLTEAERRSVLVEWNDTATAYPEDKNVHQMFERQAEKTPDAIAVVYEGRHLTYRELNYRANHLAHSLRGIGVRQGVVVGLAVGRSLEMVIGVLAILKAGGAYFPLDLSYPKERLSLMLGDAQAPVLLTQTHHLDKLPGHRATVVCLDSLPATAGHEGRDNPFDVAVAEDLAYVIYTS